MGRVAVVWPLCPTLLRGNKIEVGKLVVGGSNTIHSAWVATTHIGCAFAKGIKVFEIRRLTLSALCEISRQSGQSNVHMSSCCHGHNTFTRFPCALFARCSNGFECLSNSFGDLSKHSCEVPRISTVKP